MTTLTVLGAGDMGHGIAQLAALKGYEVRLRDVSAEALQKGVSKIQWSLEKLVANGSVAKDLAAAALGRIRATTDLREALDGSDFVIEAVPESLDLKQRVFSEVEALASPAAILATNTSALRVGEIGAKLKDPSRLVGMHFFNPVLLLSLVEVIPGPATRPDVVQRTVEVAHGIGKETVVLQKDTPGFVTTRLVATFVGAALAVAERGVASAEAIDSAFKFRAAFPMGPVELADYTGLDVGFHVAEYLAATLGPAYAPLPSLRERVQKGELGKKTGRGYYAWDGNRVLAQHSPEAGKDVDLRLVLSLVANEAARLVEEGVASPADVDRAMRLGCAFPKGPLEWADEQGLAPVRDVLLRLHAESGSPLAKPAPLLERLAGEGGRFHARAPAAAQAAPEYETLLVEVDEATRVGVVSLHRPQRLHALNDTLVRELDAALDRLEADERVRVLVLTATGEKAFCVGVDLQDGAVTPPVAAQAARRGHQLCIKMEKMTKPIVCAVNGYAFGGGLELALACDFRVAARRARLALPEVTLGLIPGMGGTQRLPKLIGQARAKQVVLFGDRIDPETAKAWGLVHEVFENESFDADARAFAARLATRAPIALRLAKQLVNVAPHTDIGTGMELEAAAFGVAASTEDVLEGVTSLFMKKPPEFQGR